MIPWLEHDTPFPPVERALKSPNGLLAAGGYKDKCIACRCGGAGLRRFNVNMLTVARDLGDIGGGAHGEALQCEWRFQPVAIEIANLHTHFQFADGD